MNQPLPLRDIHLPEAISYWPPAIGWWLLAIIILLCLLLAWRLYLRLTRRTAIKQAKHLLLEIKNNNKNSEIEKVQRVSACLRRVAISTDKSENVAGLTGESWLNYLDNTIEGHPFSQGIGRSLLDMQYRQSVPDDFDMNALLSLCETWLKGQKS